MSPLLDLDAHCLGWALRRRAIERGRCEEIAAQLQAIPPRAVDPYNPPAWSEDDDTRGLLRSLSNDDGLLDFAERIIGSINIGLYNRRFLLKDAWARGAVPLHQDSPYHRGHPHKWSFFVALSPVSPENGAIIIYERSHKLGDLGDAGEIKRSLLRHYGFAAVQPALMPGDVLAMHSSCWHESPPCVDGERLLADIILQRTSDPSTVEVLRGRRLSTATLPEDPFVRCRVSRLRELQAEVDRMTKETCMRFELSLVRSAAERQIADAETLPRARPTAPARKTVREVSDALIHNGLLIDDLPALVRTCCATMLAVAEAVDQHDIEPQVVHFIDAARALVEHARSVMDRGLHLTNWPQAQTGAVMLELAVRGTCAALSVPYDAVMREVHRATEAGELADVMGILAAAGLMRKDDEDDASAA